MIIDRNGIVEYLGINVIDSKITNRKYYYIWKGRDIQIDNRIAKFLKPFDFGIRETGAEFSVSSFIKNAQEETIKHICDIVSAEYSIVIPTGFVDALCAFQKPGTELHYDPIVSFKYNGNTVVEVSFYVTALKDKSFMNDYLNDTICHFCSGDHIVSSFMERTVRGRIADMFQIAWDFRTESSFQNKLYLKIKDLPSFTESMEIVFPNLIGLAHQDGYRFCELAFVFTAGILKSHNLYYKPL